MIATAGILADWHREHDQADAAEANALAAYREAASWRASGNRWPVPDKLEGLSDHQRQQWALASATPLGVLCGTPGTGKTHVLARVARAMLGQGHIAVCAPTGKAAVRITQALGEAGVRLTATTIHTLLGVGRNGHDGRGWAFRHNADNPLPYQAILIDEPSMLDAGLAASLFSACRPGTHVLLAGDPYQLPPVGHGAPLRDLMASGVCGVGELTEIHRNDGLIVRACADIRHGRRFDAAALGHDGNLIHVPARTPAEVQQATLLWHRPARYGTYTWEADEIQVICATNEGSPVSRKELCLALQAELADDGPNEPGHLTIGDKVICIANGQYATTGVEATYIANGEMGEVIRLEPPNAIVRFGSTVVPVPINLAGPVGECFRLGWAITVHKAQGSQWPVVIIPIDDSATARRVCSREWLYTAISRAQSLCVLVGDLGVARQMAKRPALHARKTFMRELLVEKRGAE